MPTLPACQSTQSVGERLDAELGAAPVPPLGVVPVVVGFTTKYVSHAHTTHTADAINHFTASASNPRLQPKTPNPPPNTHAPDGVARAQADPIGDGAILVRLLGQRPLGAERLLGRLYGGGGREGSVVDW